MTASSVKLAITTEDAARIVSGELVRTGGVLRNASTKAIYKILTDAEESKDVVDAAHKLAEAVPVRKPTTTALALAGAGVLVTGAVMGARSLKRHEDRRAASTRYTQSLRAYLLAAKAGIVDVSVLDQLISDLDALAKLSDNHKPTLAPTQELLTHLASYTRDLAAATLSHDVDNLETVTPLHGEASVVDIRDYLRLQRDLLTEIA